MSEIRLEVCFLSLNERLQQVILVGKKKQVARIFTRFERKVCVWNNESYRRMAMNTEDTRGFHTTFRDLVCCTGPRNPIHLSTLWQILKLKRLSYLYVKLQWNRSHVGMEVEQSSRPNSKPLRNILRLQAEQNFVSLITSHLRPILKIHSIGTWLFNLSKITFIIYKPWHLPEKSSGPQLGYSSRSVTRCISFENRSPPSQAETQTNSASNKKLKFVSFSYNKLTDVSHQTMHHYWISIIHILLST